ncbi:MAG: sigma 54-interacting transcriptional regulator [Deltaproteobacteria bacterium]|jgi:Nif-specific regulatory protein|nr:sigma 54-interacting transcriptional regulator [Deltaproteobacteria bacterium]
MATKTQETLLSDADLNLLYDVSSSISSIRDLDKMLKNILQTIKTEFKVEGASIALHDAPRKEFYFIRTVEEQKNGARVRMDTMRFPDHFGVAGWVMRENSAMIIPDISADDRFSNELDFQQKLKTRSMICVPLKTRKGLVGVLYALNKLEADFSIKESRLLEILSGTIAMAIENARMYGEIKQQADNLVKENVRLRSEIQEYFNIQGIIGSSAAMRAVFSLMEKVVNTDTSVFIQGETGTGKELIAKVIHYNSPMKDKPFVAENCGALSENLLESELFGHVKGAFTGAIADKKGLFEMADGGTVFLDEIADMPYAMQIKLLRVLQEGQVRPVGASQYRKVDFRLITSSNRDLQDKVQNGTFRDDLFYRIQVFPIVLPPLRERKEDIPPLADHFLEKFAGKRNKPASRLTPRALDQLMQHDWPGNVRELEHEIERAITLAGEDPIISEKYLSEKVRGSDQNVTAPHQDQLSLQEAVRLLERRMVADALDQTDGNRSRAARLLGLTRQGLLNKIARYKIDI